jgi:hypothetical protein
MYFTLVEFFKLLHERFPLSTMGEDFRGSHSLIYKENLIELQVWENGRAFRIGLEGKDFANIEATMDEIRMHIDTIDNLRRPKKI